MGHKILSADDSKMVRIIVNRALKPFDCELVEATNGAEALAAIKSGKPDLVILDITMPEMSGLEVLAAVRADETFKALPVIMLTAESCDTSIQEAEKLAATSYIVKPFKPEQLLEEVQKIIDLVPLPA